MPRKRLQVVPAVDLAVRTNFMKILEQLQDLRDRIKARRRYYAAEWIQDFDELVAELDELEQLHLRNQAATAARRERQADDLRRKLERAQRSR